MRTEPRPIRIRAATAGLLLTGLFILQAGCARYHDVESFITDPERVAGTEPYTVAPPDSIRIIAPAVPEIANNTVVVDIDGTVTLPLLGQLYVAGKNTQEIAAMIEDRALEYYQEADVIVRVSSYRSKHIYVFGEVGRGGRMIYTGGDNLLDILSVAGPTAMADMGRIQIYRQSDDGQVQRMTIDMDKWIETGELERNALLAENDIVYVPPHGLARVALTLQQVLLPLQPVSSTIQAPKSLQGSWETYEGESESTDSSD